MSTRVKVAIRGLSPITGDWDALAVRSQAIELIESAADAEAVITDCEQVAARATDAGQWVLLANPFDACENTSERLRRSQRSMPGQVMRFQPSIAQVNQALDTGKLGDLGLLRIHYWGAGAGSKAALAGQLDLALWVFGGMPCEIFAVERPDYRQVHLGFDGGGMAIVDLDAHATSASGYYSLSVIGSSGAAYADDHHNMHLRVGPHDVSALPVAQGDAMITAMIDEFATAIRDDSDFYVNWDDTHAALQLAAAVTESAQQDAVVTGGDRG